MADTSQNEIATTRSGACGPVNAPGIDCDCVDALIESNWSDTEETDAAAIISGTDENMSQQSIDILIDVATQADAICTSTK